MSNRSATLGFVVPVLGLALSLPAGAATLTGKVSFAARTSSSKGADLYGKFGQHTGDGSGAGDEARMVIALVPASGSVPPASGKDIPVMNQLNQQFQPRIQVVQAGSPVRFLNSDPIFHNVFSLSSVKKFDLGRYPRGDSRVVSFDQPGVVNVFCDIHPHMNAFIVVVPTPYYTVSDPEGNYRVEDVPPGKYEIRGWCPGMASPITLGNCVLTSEKETVWDGDLRGL